MSEKHESERRFPIQGGLTVSWTAAEEAYRGYARLYGTSQSLERLGERGGFGLQEFVCNVAAARCSSVQQAREATHQWPSDQFVVAVLVAADVRAGTAHHETLRQLAEVTAERDALRAEAAPLRAPDREDIQRAHRLLTVLRSGEDLLKKLDSVEAERDALKRRVEELEQRRQPHAKGPCTCGAPEWCPA